MIWLKKGSVRLPQSPVRLLNLPVRMNITVCIRIRMDGCSGSGLPMPLRFGWWATFPPGRFWMISSCIVLRDVMYGRLSCPLMPSNTSSFIVWRCAGRRGAVSVYRLMPAELCRMRSRCYWRLRSGTLLSMSGRLWILKHLLAV